MKLPFFQVDAFADRPFGGNPAAVIPLETWLPDETLQAIAAENNLSETAFAIPATGDADYELRWFTPTTEVALCGHATLASGHVLIQGEAVRFRTRKAGVLIVGRNGDALTLDLPITRVAPRRTRSCSEPWACRRRSCSSRSPAPRRPRSSWSRTRPRCAPASPTCGRCARSS
jgi:predicted PhzF superfamily epimerase YddE/YHI9